MGTLHNLFEKSIKQESEPKTDSFSATIAKNVANKKRQAEERRRANAKTIRNYRLKENNHGES